MSKIDLSEITELQAKQADRERSSEELREAEERQMATIRQRLIDGETTGVELQDLVIIRTGRLDQDVIDLYYDLQARVSSFAGEPVMVVGRHEKQTSHSLGPLPHGEKHEGQVVERAALGILSSDSIQITDRAKGEWCFPTDRYGLLTDHYWSRDSGPFMQDGMLATGTVMHRFGRQSLYEGWLGRPLDLRLHHRFLKPAEAHPIALEVYVGNAEIVAYVDRDQEQFSGAQVIHEQYNALAHLLGLPEKPLLSKKEHRDRYLANRQNPKTSAPAE